MCWDGSLGVFKDNLCQCPPIPVDEPEVEEQPAEEEPSTEEANPNCTTGNRQSCDRAGGQWDFTSCVCEFNSNDTEEPVEPPTVDEASDDEQDDSNEIEQQEEDEGEDFVDPYDIDAMSDYPKL